MSYCLNIGQLRVTVLITICWQIKASQKSDALLSSGYIFNSIAADIIICPFSIKIVSSPIRSMTYLATSSCKMWHLSNQKGLFPLTIFVPLFYLFQYISRLIIIITCKVYNLILLMITFLLLKYGWHIPTL